MSDFLCLRWRDATLTPLSVVSWAVLEPGSNVLAAGNCLLQDLDLELPEQSGSRRVMVLAPSEHLMLTRVSVPDGQRRHLKQVLPFMVEERIIDPIESMHIATPSVISAAELDVGCVRREQLEQWLDCLAALEIKPDYLFADVECISRERGDWRLLFEHDRVLFSAGSEASAGASPVSMAMSHSSGLAVLQMLLSQCQDPALIDEEQTEAVFDELEEGDGTAVPVLRPEEVALIVSQSEDLDALHERRAELLEALANKEADADDQTTVGDLSVTDDPVPSLADTYASNSPADNQSELAPAIGLRKQFAEFLRSENVAATELDYRETTTEFLAVGAVRDYESPINFLQGDYTPINANAATRRFMRRVVMASAACLALFLCFSLAGGFYLNSRAENFNARSVAIYKELFPGERIRDPVRQMRSKLKSGNVAATSSDFLPLLDIASKTLDNLGEEGDADTVIKQLRYDAQRGNVTMELQMANIDQLESYRDLLTGEGLSVDILSANQDGNIVNGRLQIGRS